MIAIVMILKIGTRFSEQQNQRLQHSRLAGVVLAGDEIDPLEWFNLQIAETAKVFYVEAG